MPRDGTRREVKTIDLNDTQLLEWGEKQLQLSCNRCLAMHGVITTG